MIDVCHLQPVRVIGPDDSRDQLQGRLSRIPGPLVVGGVVITRRAVYLGAVSHVVCARPLIFRKTLCDPNDVGQPGREAS